MDFPSPRDYVPIGFRIQEYGPLRAIVAKANEPDLREFIIVGYASPQVIDREKHLIKREALAEDLPRFLAHPKYRNANIVHSNIQVAEVLPAWTNPDTGEEWTTHVDEVGLFCVVKVRTDRFRPAICRRVEEDILSGKLNSFSISGDAPFESRQYTCANDQCFWVIDKIELYEITICEEGVNQDAKFSVVAKADAMRLSQFCADGSCPINLGGVGMINPTERKSPSPAGGDAPEGVAVGAEGAKGLESDVARDDPRQADQEKPGQDWVQKAYDDCGGQDNCPLNEKGKGCAYHGAPFTKAASGPTMIRRDVSPTAGGGGFNTTRPDQLKAADADGDGQSAIADEGSDFGSRVQKYLRKGDLGTMDHGISKPKLETTGGGGGKMTKERVDEHLDAQGGTAHHQPDWQAFDPEDESGVHGHSPGDLSHGLEESKRENPGHSHWHTAPQHGNQGTIRGRSTPNPPSNRTPQHHLDRENLALTLPDNGEPTAIQRGGWRYGGTLRQRASAAGPSGASRQRAGGRRRPEEPAGNDYWRAHEAPSPADERLLALAAENASLARQLALATKSDEQRKKDKNAYMAEWRKKHPNGGASARASRNIQPSRITSPEANRRAPQSEGNPEGREKKPANIGGPGAQQHADDIFAKYGGDPTKKALTIAKRYGLKDSGADLSRGDLARYIMMNDGTHPRQGRQRWSPTADAKRKEPRRRAYGVEDPDDGAYDKRPTNESRALTLARQIAAAIGSDGKPDAPKASAETLKRQDAFNAKMAKKPAKRRPKPAGRGSWGYD